MIIKTSSGGRSVLACVTVAFLLVLGLSQTAHAYPPAPYHALFGMVRDQWGRPIDISSAQVFVETTNGVSVRAVVAMSIEPGVNYRINVPMDSGTAKDPYTFGALNRNQQFRLKVKIGATVYLPMEMALRSPVIGQPAESTRMDLTLGEDTDGDGLPDGWERALIAVMGGTLASITPNGDADGDGISNLNEYLAGTYPFDPSDGFTLKLVSVSPEATVLRFMAIKNRTYTVKVSSDLQHWNPVDFRVVSGGSSGPLQGSYQATESKFIDVAVTNPAGGASVYCFRGFAQ